MSEEAQDLHESFEDFFENSLCGHLIVTPAGSIVRCNGCFAVWIGQSPMDLRGKRFSDLLSIGGRIYFETHLAPLLKMQGYFEEIALELVSDDGGRIPVLVNALERPDPAGKSSFVRLTIYKAQDRRRFEDNLIAARTEAETRLSDAHETAILREQFIAVLGHDLRNPLGAISMGTALLAESTTLGVREKMLLNTMIESARRMNELIENALDFARGRLGGGMKLTLRPMNLEPILLNAVEELRMMHPGREITADFDFSGPVSCDSGRLAQLLSNLIANALTHGSQKDPVRVEGRGEDSISISIRNRGDAIPPDLIPVLFEPFTREKVSASQNGLGLGLYIASEIARAHGGELSVSSTDEETRFTYSMPRGIPQVS